MPEIKILRMSNTDDAFYSTMGPFLSRRKIVSELGFPVWDEDDKAWYVAISSEEVIGFACSTKRADATVFHSDYVLPGWRGVGVYKRLIADRLSDVQQWPVRAVATPASAPILEKYGFAVVRMRGKYSEMVNAGPLLYPTVHASTEVPA